CAIISHPYGPLGGDMNNNIVMSLAQHYAQQGYSVLRYNQRGVGQSAGRTSWTAQEEVKDLEQICAYVLEHCASITLVGYSFGALVSLGAATNCRHLDKIVLISYPAGVMFSLTAFHSQYYIDLMQSLTNVEKLLIIGDKDNFTSVSSFKSWTDQVPDPKIVHVVEDCNHFWFGKERKILQYL
ncbi:Alpha/Beta hydrolase protein, partial [Gorgonomyces haynaldii]